ncbi:hypothetical protein [Nakamurella panacisegetis]|uniref:hypothetical protein n=1 Tax=Nakamurella panacisegetis TaxID=1090615 RepID=UPI0012FE3F63|nr:hypothetical protein [Nakamurella panacisegetis]
MALTCGYRDRRRVTVRAWITLIQPESPSIVGGMWANPAGGTAELLIQKLH